MVMFPASKRGIQMQQSDAEFLRSEAEKMERLAQNDPTDRGAEISRAIAKRFRDIAEKLPASLSCV